jgi:transketolase
MEGPTVLALTRQKLPVLDGLAALEKGGYVLRDADEPEIVLIASGSEVSLALEAADLLAAEGVAGRVVSMPSWKLFASQTAAYQDSVLPPEIPRIAIEAGVGMGWERWVGSTGKIVSIERFGASGPYQTVMAEFGFTAENVAAEARSLL